MSFGLGRVGGGVWGSAWRAMSGLLVLGMAACQGSDATPAGGAGSVRVVVNEIYASGGDPLGDPDWIELKNLADQPADLSGFRLRDDKTPFTLPTGTTVAARGYLLVYADDAPDGGASDRLHAPFKLGGSDEVSLLAPDGTVLDSLAWSSTMSSAGRTWGRLPDGTGQYLSLTPTPAARNL